MMHNCTSIIGDLNVYSAIANRIGNMLAVCWYESIVLHNVLRTAKAARSALWRYHRQTTRLEFQMIVHPHDLFKSHIPKKRRAAYLINITSAQTCFRLINIKVHPFSNKLQRYAAHVLPTVMSFWRSTCDIIYRSNDSRYVSSVLWSIHNPTFSTVDKSGRNGDLFKACVDFNATLPGSVMPLQV